MRRIVHVVGARPNFVKMAPVVEALSGVPEVQQEVVHTGQHYDARMSDEVLGDLGLPVPDRFLGIGSAAHGEQTARALSAFELVLQEEPADYVVVAGDVNSTLACALAAAKLGVPVAHVESGLRSNDWAMPEEINRVLTDRLSDLLFTHSPEARGNLHAEGIDLSRVRYVGNTMIDSLRKFEPAARDRAHWRSYSVEEGSYVLVTLHRPSNVDNPARLTAVVRHLCELAARFPVVFPIHPRTAARLREAGRLDELVAAGVRVGDPVRYLDFLSLEAGAGAVLTDSGGLQEETSALGVPCFTLRANTERPITISQGTNVLLGDDPAAIEEVRLAPADRRPGTIPLWDGRAGTRVAAALLDAMGVESGARTVAPA